MHAEPNRQFRYDDILVSTSCTVKTNSGLPGVGSGRRRAHSPPCRRYVRPNRGRHGVEWNVSRREDGWFEDELAGIGLDGQDRVALIMFVLNHRHQQGLPREAFVHEDLALEKRVVLAIAFSVCRVVPLIDDAPMFRVRTRFIMGADLFAGPFDFLYCPRCRIDVERRERAAVTPSRVTAQKSAQP